MIQERVCLWKHLLLQDAYNKLEYILDAMVFNEKFTNYRL